MSSSPDTGLPAGYARWQERLAVEFFGARRDQPIVMFVDRDELQELADHGEDGVRSLAAAVRELVDVRVGAGIFVRARKAQDVWNRGLRTDPPPTLPILALSVLAASEMRRDESGASHNYYIRLARVLLPDGSEAAIEDLRFLLRTRGAFIDVVDMWKGLHSWLNEQQGAFGLSTIPENPKLSRIGYALSQALVRRSDRAALTRFFDRMNLVGAGVPGPDALLRLLNIWTRRRSQGLSDRFVEVLDDPDYETYLKPLIHDLALAWDGKVITAEGLRRLEIRLALDIDRGDAWWVVPSVADVPGDILNGTSDGEAFSAIITSDVHSSMFQVEGLPPVKATALTTGFSARGSLCVAELQPSRLLVLIDNAHAGGWTSVDAVRAYEEQAFVVALDLAPLVVQALNLAADTGWKRLPQPTAERSLPGYAIFYGVIFSDPEALERAIRELPGAVAASIRVGSAARPRLIQGLPLFRHLNRQTYLAGGEPDLELPVGAEPRDVAVLLDDRPPQTFRASIFPIPFSRFGPYDAGSHEILADDLILRFVVHGGAGDDRQPPDAAGLSWRGASLGPTTEDAEICGALTSGFRSPEVELVRRGARGNWLVDRSGRATPLHEPERPGILPDLAFMSFELPRDEADWLLQEWTNGWQAVRLRAAEPAFQSLSEQDHRVWSAAASSVRTDDPTWRLYLEEWERVRGR